MYNEYQREYRKERLRIDGRTIPYTISTASGYLAAHDDMPDEKIDDFYNKNPDLYTRINQIIALKQSCFLLLHTSHSCQSLSDDLYALKIELIKEIKEKYGYEFDDTWMESLVPKEGSW